MSFSPTGNLSSNHVQGALAELDSEKSPKDGTGATGTWPINISGNAATASSCSGNAATSTNAGYANSAGRAKPQNSGGGNFDLVIQELGNPYYMVGTDDTGATLKLVPRGTMSVNYANSAGSAPANGGNADTLDGYHYYNLPYAGTNAITNVAVIGGVMVTESVAAITTLRCTRATGATFDIGV